MNDLDLMTETAKRLRAAGCVFAEEEAQILIDSAGTPAELADLIAARASGRPLEQVVGWAEFLGRRIAVAPGVFVPRRRSEFLASLAAAAARPGSVVVDLCCGSGAIGAAVAAAVDRIDLHAADNDPAAVDCARGNLAAFGGRVYLGDLFQALPTELAGRIEVLTVNAPYVPTSELAFMPEEARRYEPRGALDGGGDGLALHRRVAAEAADWLAPGAAVLIETSTRQSAETTALLAAAGLATRLEQDPELGATVAFGVAPG